jgi:hypothetical protein
VPRFGFQSGFQVDLAAATKTSPVSILIAHPADGQPAFKLFWTDQESVAAQELSSCPLKSSQGVADLGSHWRKAWRRLRRPRLAVWPSDHEITVGGALLDVTVYFASVGIDGRFVIPATATCCRRTR